MLSHDNTPKCAWGPRDPDPAQRSLTRSQTKGLQRLWTAFLQTLYEPAEADHNQLGCSSCDALVCSFSCLEVRNTAAQPLL